jgi:multidrug efflux pump subunit AcrA (membrane-fusion protein)
MDHAQIEEQQIVDRYVRGTLPAAEVAGFEEHYLSCQDCLDQLDLAESMNRGFKRAAGQDAVRVAAAHQLAVVAWLARLGRSRQAAVLVMALLVAVLLPWGLAERRIADRDRELARTRSTLEHERSAASSRGTAEAEKLRTELEASRRDLAREQEQLTQARQPQGNVPILNLSVERGGPSGEPTARLHLPRTPGWIVLVLMIDPPRPSYRVILRDAGRKEVWSGDGLHPDANDSLSLSLPSTLLAPGDYTVTAESLAPGGKPVAAGRFVFRVLPAG